MPTPVRFGRLERRAILLGLNAVQLSLVAVAFTIAVASVYIGGAARLVAVSPVWVLLLVAATASVRGRLLVDWLPVVVHWKLRTLLGQTAHVRRPRRPATTSLRLPGVRGTLHLAQAPTLGGVLVHDRRAGTVTAIACVHGRGFVLEDAAAQEYKVAAWGRVLASMCQQPALVRVQLVLRTVPGGPGLVRRWWVENARAHGSWASRVVADLVSQDFALTRRQDALVAIAVRAPRGSNRHLTAAGLARIEQDLAAVAGALTAAELHLDGWVRPDQLGAVLRTAYDPAGAATTDTDPLGAASPLLGPMGITENWSHLRTDSGLHVTYWVIEWPRSEVDPTFLQPLLLAPGAFRTVTLIAEPISAHVALREIRRGKVEQAADSAQRIRAGQIEDEATRADAAELARREQEIVAGHGDLAFTGLITVTGATPAELDAACAATEAAAAQAMCEVRRLVGQQGQAHLAATVPLARGVR